MGLYGDLVIRGMLYKSQVDHCTLWIVQCSGVVPFYDAHLPFIVRLPDIGYVYIPYALAT